MPLLKAALNQGLPAAEDAPYPDSVAAAANAWATAVQGWAAGILPPSTTVAAAVSALEPQLVAAFSSGDAAGPMDSAFVSFAVVLGAGMLPAYLATPPAGPPGFASIFAQPAPETRAEGVERVAALLDSWMRTGTAQLVLPPKTVTPWA